MKKRFYRLVIIVLSIFSFTLQVEKNSSAQSSPQSLKIPEVVAQVNGVDIQSKYIEFRMNQILKNVKRPLTIREKTSVVKDLIEKEIVRELVNQQGKKNNLEVGSGLIEKEMTALRKPYDSDEEFEKALGARNITIDDLKKSITVDINARKLLNQEIKGKITISDADVKKYYEENKHKFHRPESYRARHILAAIFPPDMLRSTPVTELQNKKEELTQKAEEKIDKIIKELKEGANFEELAKRISDDEASRENGGDLDVIYKGIFDPTFDEAVSKLNPGEISGKVETQFGFHVIKLTEKRPPEQAPFKELEEAIQKHLFMEEAKVLVASYVEDLKKEAKIKTFFK
ncbi:MAG: peptidylprolyl isomerase [Nitrospinia bacterium]|tara:strand:+ start:165 stop:1196 length:1032 start_codon:yes stop_codon:yes gene_type:complete